MVFYIKGFVQGKDTNLEFYREGVPKTEPRVKVASFKAVGVARYGDTELDTSSVENLHVFMQKYSFALEEMQTIGKKLTEEAKYYKESKEAHENVLSELRKAFPE